MTKIIFIPTWHCNLACSYCDYTTKSNNTDGYILEGFHKVRTIGRELSPEEWLKYLDKFRPYLLEMTGGEPTKYLQLPELLKSLPEDCKWATTSNTLLTEQIEKLPSYNCLSWTASYHYHSDDKFIANLMFLRKRGILARVTLVLTPQNADTCFSKIEQFVNLGFGVNIHPVLKQGFSWAKDMDIWNKAQSMISKAVCFVSDIPFEWKPERYFSCKAGDGYFCVLPDGQVLRCYSEIFTDNNRGHISDYKMPSGLRECNIDCMFPCDRQVEKGGKVNVYVQM